MSLFARTLIFCAHGPFIFALANFAAAAPADATIGGTTTVGRPHLMAVMAASVVAQDRSPSGVLVPTAAAITAATAASCLARMMVRCRSLKAASGGVPGGSRSGNPGGRSDPTPPPY